MDSKVFFIQKQKETLGNILIRILCFLFLISGSAGAFALQPDIVKEVRGVVLDVNNEPLTWIIHSLHKKENALLVYLQEKH